MDNDVKDDLRLVAANARFQLSGITPRHSRYATYYKAAQTAEAAIERIEFLEKRLAESWSQR